MSESQRVLIIGAGLSGLAAAIHLEAASTEARPIEVLLVDKGRGVGGRLATRRMGGATLDHGAQFFTVRSEQFRTAVDRWLADGVVEEWCRGFAIEDGYPRYRSAGGMNALAKHLASELSVVKRQRANAIIPGPDRWAVAYEASTREPDEADAIIATPPVPQTMELLRAGPTMVAADTEARLAAMTYHKVIAVLVTLDRSPELPAPGALQRPDHPTFSFVSDNQQKGISDVPAVTFHLSHPLSDKLWDWADDAVVAEVGGELAETVGGAGITETQVKRWRYAGPKNPYADPTMRIASIPGPLYLAGDGFGGSKVEGAFLSGVAAAEGVLADLDGKPDSA